MTIRLPDELVKNVDSLAKELDRTRTYIIKTALEEFFEEYADYYVALHRMHDKKDPFVTLEEAREILGL